MIRPEKYKMVGMDIEVDVVRVTAANMNGVANWIGFWMGTPGRRTATPKGFALDFDTSEGPHRAHVGDWVIKAPMSRSDFYTATAGMFQASFKKITKDLESHDENTLLKVYATLTKYGMSNEMAIDVVNDLQNEGILFREMQETKTEN